jgi:hypothetical protein
MAASAAHLVLAASAALAIACSGSKTSHQADRDATTGMDASDGAVTRLVKDGGSPEASPASDAASDAGHRADAGGGAHDASPPTCRTPVAPESCAAPSLTALPVCTLALTGCMDAKKPTAFGPRAVYYEVNSPLWSDGAAKTRAFVLPAGSKIHVDGVTGKWEFPVGTVLIKNFLLDGKLVETRLFMHVDAATAALIQNGTDWVGYNYAWNAAQTEATIVPDARTAALFDTGTRKVTWSYPSFIDCIGCHSAAVGPIGPETRQMNRVVGGQNQIDAFVAAGLFDAPPVSPYAAALVEPYANTALGLAGPPPGATLDDRARSYLSANCGFCHRPDVNDQGFDLRYGATLAQVGICNLSQQNGIPGMTTAKLVDLAPGDHAASAMWIRMNTPVPPTDPLELQDVGRMPPAASVVVDTQGTQLIADWIDSIASCPKSDGGI